MALNIDWLMCLSVLGIIKYWESTLYEMLLKLKKLNDFTLKIKKLDIRGLIFCEVYQNLLLHEKSSTLKKACTMADITLTDQNDRSVSPELVPDSFPDYLSKIAHALDAMIHSNNIHPNYNMNVWNYSHFFAYTCLSWEVLEIITGSHKKKKPTNEIHLFIY